MACGAGALLIHELQRAGGADYLHTLTSIVPTAANAGSATHSCAKRNSDGWNGTETLREK